MLMACVVQRYIQYLRTLLPEAQSDPCSQAFQKIHAIVIARVSFPHLSASYNSRYQAGLLKWSLCSRAMLINACC